ncbi:MAG: hypothetical protein F6K30_14905 [Cyanothece sp. SIO2G6]|nr:hypothetical protein [Cyanothece sp. SIO2G6]
MFREGEQGRVAMYQKLGAISKVWVNLVIISKGRRQKVEGRSVEGRRQKAEGRRQKVEGRRQKAEGRR